MLQNVTAVGLLMRVFQIECMRIAIWHIGNSDERGSICSFRGCVLKIFVQMFELGILGNCKPFRTKFPRDRNCFLVVN